MQRLTSIRIVDAYCFCTFAGGRTGRSGGMKPAGSLLAALFVVEPVTMADEPDLRAAAFALAGGGSTDCR